MCISLHQVGKASQSHFHLMTRLSETLVTKGHHVTMPIHAHMSSKSRQVEVLHYGSALTSEEWEANTQSYMRELVYGNVTVYQAMLLCRTVVGF